MSLSNGVLQNIISSEVDDLPENPVLQILGIKVLPSKQGQDRYRVVLSDGDNFYTSCMLGTQLNGQIADDTIANGAVVQLTSYTCNLLQNTRKVIIVLDLETVEGPQAKIGNPVQMSDLVANHTNINPAPQQNMSTSSSENSNRDTRPPQPQPQPQPQPPATTHANMRNAPIFNPGQRNQANEPSRGGAASSASAANVTSRPPLGPSSSGAVYSASGRRSVLPISALTPYQNKWTLRARVTSKSGIRTWSNSRGEGKLFSLDLLDESGEIRVTGFNESVDKFYEMIEAGKVYYITKGQVKTANKKFSNLKNDYEISMSNDTTIELCNEDVALPTLQYKFVKITDIGQIEKDALVDLIGIVKEINDVTSITTRATNKQVSKRDITIVDDSLGSIRTTLWGTEAEKFGESGLNLPVVAIKGAKVSDFSGRSLSVLSSSNFITNPDIPEAHTLRAWCDNGGMEGELTSMSGGGGFGDSGVFKTISQIQDENLGTGEKADFFSVRAHNVFIKKENCMYQACPGGECNKKVREDNGQYRCEKCDRSYPDFKYRLMLQSNIADHTGSQWITSFQDQAEVMLGTTAATLGQMKEEDENQFEKIMSDASFKPFVLKLRAKVETYQDEAKLKCVTVGATPLDFKSEAKRLIKEIKELKKNE